MSAAVGTEGRGVSTSPQIWARTGGVLYLITIVIGALGETVVRVGVNLQRRNERATAAS